LPIVGTKGQVVISKEIRETLGIKAGWLAVEEVVDGRVQLTFFPPVTESRMGALAGFVPASKKGAAWDDIREAAWEAAARDQELGPAME
jgi:AbrB family looped-hinge helix DNA binding protein